MPSETTSAQSLGNVTIVTFRNLREPVQVSRQTVAITFVVISFIFPDGG
jgi:hypothetical protein